MGRPCGTKNHLDDGPAFALLWPCQHTYLPVLLTDEHLSVVCTVITFVFITKQGATVSKILLARVYLYLTKVSDAHLIIDDGSATLLSNVISGKKLIPCFWMFHLHS